MIKERVSVIIRTYNRRKMLRRAIESVAKQTWENREAVVINDGGESVQDIVDEFAGQVDIVHLPFDAANKPGRCGAANEGIEASTGEWICYLDDDDFYYPNHLETLMAAAKDSGAMCLYTDSNLGQEEPMGEDGEYVIINVEPGPSEDFTRYGFYIGTYIHLSTFCHHRRLYDALGGFDLELSVLEDLDLFFRYSHDHEFHHVRKVTTQFQVRGDNTNAITSMRKEFVETREMLWRKYMHTVIPDMMVLMKEGHARLLGFAAKQDELLCRIDELEGRVAELENRRS